MYKFSAQFLSSVNLYFKMNINSKLPDIGILEQREKNGCEKWKGTNKADTFCINNRQPHRNRKRSENTTQHTRTNHNFLWPTRFVAVDAVFIVIIPHPNNTFVFITQMDLTPGVMRRIISWRWDCQTTARARIMYEWAFAWIAQR